MIGLEGPDSALSKSAGYGNEVEFGVGEIGQDGDVGSDGGEEL